MASFDEVAVEARIILTRDREGASRIVVQGRSLTANGMAVRSFREDVTDVLGPVRRAAAIDLLDAVVARVKAQWEIP